MHDAPKRHEKHCRILGGTSDRDEGEVFTVLSFALLSLNGVFMSAFGSFVSVSVSWRCRASVGHV